MAMGETHNALRIGEIRQSMAQIVEKQTIYNYSSDFYMDCIKSKTVVTHDVMDLANSELEV